MTLSSLASRDTLFKYFPHGSIIRGMDYFIQRKVISVTREEEKLSGLVWGTASQPYLSELWFSAGEQAQVVESQCSCPVGEACKHTVAVLLDYLGQNKDISGYADRPRPLVMDASPNATVRSSPSILPSEVVRSIDRLAVAFNALNLQSAVEPPEVARARKGMLVYLVPKILGRQGIGPRIELNHVSLLKDGSFGSTQTIQLERILNNPAQYVSAEDTAIGDLWQTILAKQHWGYGSTLDRQPELFNVLFKKILDTKRCYFEHLTGPVLSFGPTLTGKVDWLHSSTGEWHLKLVATDGSAKHECTPWKAPWYVDRQTGLCGMVEHEYPVDVLSALGNLRGLTDEEAKLVPALLAKSGLLSYLPPPPVPGAISVRVVKPTPELDLEIVPSPSEESEKVKAVTFVSRNDQPANALITLPDGEQVYEVRDPNAEREFVTKLESFGFVETPQRPDPRSAGSRDASAVRRLFVAADAGSWLNLDPQKLNELRDDGWKISPAAEEKFRPLELDDSNLEFEVEGESEDSWWFSLAVNIQVNGRQVPLLPLLVAAIRRLPVSVTLSESIEKLNQNGKFVCDLADGTVISLPFDRMRAMLVSLQEMLLKGKTPKYIDASVFQADDIMGDHARWINGDKIRELSDRLKQLNKPSLAVVPPKSFRAELRPYQLEGLAWLQKLASLQFAGLLADDMGLGKTVQLLAHVCLEKEQGRLNNPFLVVCPTSVLPNWISEIERFAPHLNVASYHGADRQGNYTTFADFDVVVTTYPILQRDTERLQWVAWHGVALDEAQSVKNASTKVAQSVRALKAGHRFCLTGTPVENHLGELWSQFQFLLPGLLGDKLTFKQFIRDPIEKDGNVARRSLLTTRIRPFLLRRTKNEVATELPEKTTIVQYVELDAAQADLYETVRLASSKKVRDEITKKGFRQSQIWILDALLKLRQACCHPELVKLTAARKCTTSAKFEKLLEMLQELVAEGRKILVFSQFTSMLALIEAELREQDLPYVILTGDTKDRKTPVEEFQKGSVPIFLISLKAGGTGLNLTASDVVIHYDPWWNPAVEEQATDRAHRIGQTKHVFVYKLIAKGTIEERMMALQQRKRELAESIYSQDGTLSRALGEADIEDLLRPIDQLCE